MHFITHGSSELMQDGCLPAWLCPFPNHVWEENVLVDQAGRPVDSPLDVEVVVS